MADSTILERIRTQVAMPLWDWIAPTAVYEEPSMRRRAQVLGAATGLILVIGTLRAVVFAMSGAPWVALGFVVIAGTGGAYLWCLRRGMRLSLIANIFGAQLFLVLMATSVFRGGIGSVVLGVLGMLVVKMAFTGGIRAAVAWWMISVAGVVALAVSEGLGWVSLPDQLESSGYVMDAVVAVIIPTAALLISSAFEWSRVASEQALTEALDQHARAEQEAIMSKADKMASIGLLAAGVGHEINNPLTFIGGNIDFVISSLDENNPEQRALIEALRDASDGVSRVARITGDLSTFARPDSGFATESVDLNAVAKTAVRLTRPEVEYRAQLRVNLNPVAPVQAHEGKLVQVLVNFLLNAAHAVEVRTDGEIEVRTGETNGEVWLEVVDNGVGIRPEDQERIFDPFFTTKAVGKGTGLGLSTSRSLVQSMGGRLTVVSAQGDGAVFRLILPAEPSPRQRHVAPPVKGRTSTLRILVVDDEKMLERLIPRMLAPHSVVFCNSVSQAMMHLKDDSAFDVVLSDVMMHPTPGWEFLEQVRRAHPELEGRFAFMTGGAFTPAARAQVDGSGVPVISKPFTREDLEAALKRDARTTVPVAPEMA